MPSKRILPIQVLVNFVLLIVLVGLYFYIVSQSYSAPLHLWDEALYANNAVDMVQNHNYWVYTVADTIDHHNTKPPLALWMQAAAGASLGFSEFSVRLPTYLVLAGILILLCGYLRRFTGSWTPGLLASVFCLTTLGLIRHHVFLTGDLDGVLVFWTTWIVLHWVYCLQQDPIRPADYAILTTLFCAGYLTKSTAVLLIVPTLLVMGCFYGHRFRKLLLSRYTLISLLAFSGTCALYYVLREWSDPGYWAIVWWSEFTRISEDVQPWLHFEGSYYFEQFYDPLFQEYFFLLVALLLPFLILRKIPHKKRVLAMVSGATVYLGFISIPPVKLEWYAAPVYPILCAAIGLMVWELAVLGLRTPSVWRRMAVAALAVIVAITVKNSFIHVQNELADEPHSGYAHQTVPDGLKLLHDRHPDVQTFKVLIPPTPTRFAHHLDELTFYKAIYEHDEGKRVIISDLPAAFSTRDTLICDRERLDQLTTHYHPICLDSTAGGAMWVVLAAIHSKN